MPDIFVSKEYKKKVKAKAPQKKHLITLDEISSKSIKKAHLPPWGAYAFYPKNVKYYNQDPEEEIILILRKHMITNVGWIIVAIIMVFAPTVLKTFPLLEFLPLRFQFIAVLGWYLGLTAFVLEGFLGWFFNVYIITDERVIDVDFINLIYREVTDANIDKIQDVTVQVGGVSRAIFNYGNVLIQTAAELPLIEFNSVPKPDKVSRLLRDLRIEEEQEKIEGRVR